MGLKNSKIHTELETYKNENYVLKSEIEDLNKLNNQLKEEINVNNDSFNLNIIKLKEENKELNEKINKYVECLDSYPEPIIKRKKV